MRDQGHYDEVYEHFRRRYRRRDRLTYHMMAWFVVNGVLWLHWYVTRPGWADHSSVLTFSGLWMCVVLGHILNYVGSELWPRRAPHHLQRRVRNVVNAALDREDTPPPKPKRDWLDSRTRLILTEDGEYIDGDDQAMASPRQQERQP
jgi:hypothetical protein